MNLWELGKINIGNINTWMPLQRAVHGHGHFTE